MSILSNMSLALNWVAVTALTFTALSACSSNPTIDPNFSERMGRYLEQSENRKKIWESLERALPIVKERHKTLRERQNTEIANIIKSHQRIDTDCGMHEGEQDALIEIVEFSSFNCPHSRASHEVIRQLMTTYPGQFHHVFKQYYSPDHGDVPAAAHIALAANDLGRFEEMKAKLFEYQGDLDHATFRKIAQEMGIDFKKLDALYRKNLKEHDRIIRANIAQAEKLGVEATPTFFINGVKVVGERNLDFFDALLKRTNAEGR